uniref:NADH-ubiquinone oxidoreductase chain 2 n=1 Tax=Staphylinidae sp. BMNH 1274226 TaxID=1796564 RepID=A0A140EGZ7_9COLE|nr:NADH dehydrogenase subunit 2 [Staphylinidae sp. BMNH 1274226]
MKVMILFFLINFKYWKLIFYMILFMSISITISTYSWFNMWIGLEINMLTIIPLMNNTKNMFMTESSLKYFIVQAMASSLLLLSIIMMSIYQKNFKILLLMNSALLIKLGSAPFHFWFPEVMEGQMWNMNYILLTMQKISPFMLLNYNMNMPYFFSMIIIMNMMVSMLMGLNQISLRKIMTFSSMNHIAWMIAAIFFIKTIWMMYFLIYMFMLMNIIYIFNMFNIFYIKQLIKINLSLYLKMLILLNFFNMGGLPPFIGFLPKWLTIQSLINFNFKPLMTIMVILTLFTLFYYTRLMMSSLIMMKNYNLMKYPINKLIMVMLWINLLSLPLIFMIFMN